MKFLKAQKDNILPIKSGVSQLSPLQKIKIWSRKWRFFANFSHPTLIFAFFLHLLYFRLAPTSFALNHYMYSWFLEKLILQNCKKVKKWTFLQTQRTIWKTDVTQNGYFIYPLCSCIWLSKLIPSIFDDCKSQIFL